MAIVANCPSFSVHPWHDWSYFDLDGTPAFARCLGIEPDPLATVRALITAARKVSPSASMSVYVVDLERALGLTDLPSPHKRGSSE